jgi:hypothetical protein
VQVLGIEVETALVDRWRSWLMPERQPYIVSRSTADAHGWADERARLDFEVLDAFELYAVPSDQSIVCLDRRQARDLDPKTRQLQRARHRWPSPDVERDRQRAIRYVESGRRSSRHREVPSALWQSSAAILPGGAALAGTFADRSGPNCFGTVMGAAGVAGAFKEWMQVDPFESWLAENTVRGGHDEEVGTILVWRTGEGTAAHAAVTLGDGWLLHKPSQGWMSPTKVLSVRDGKLSARYRGQRLHRYRLVTKRGS